MQCKMTKVFFGTQRSIWKRNINVEPQYIDYLKQKGFQSVPVIEAEGQPLISGFQPDMLSKIAG